MRAIKEPAADPFSYSSCPILSPLPDGRRPDTYPSGFFAVTCPVLHSMVDLACALLR
jgi:hypothetical protein